MRQVHQKELQVVQEVRLQAAAHRQSKVRLMAPEAQLPEIQAAQEVHPQEIPEVREARAEPEKQLPGLQVMVAARLVAELPAQVRVARAEAEPLAEVARHREVQHRHLRRLHIL